MVAIRHTTAVNGLLAPGGLLPPSSAWMSRMTIKHAAVCDTSDE
jgi:hypothetical protein